MDAYGKLAINVATQFKKYREKAGMTQAEVAAKAGVTVETVARLERVLRGRDSANANPSLETLARLAYAVGVDPLALLRDGGLMLQQTDRLDLALKRASQPVRNTLAVIAEALVADEGATWGFHSEASPFPGAKKKAKKPRRKR